MTLKTRYQMEFQNYAVLVGGGGMSRILYTITTSLVVVDGLKEDNWIL